VTTYFGKLLVVHIWCVPHGGFAPCKKKKAMTMNIPELLDKREAVNVKYSKEGKVMQAAFEAECQTAWKKKFLKRKFTLAKSAKDNQPEHGEIWNRYVEQNQMTYKQHNMTETLTLPCKFSRSGLEQPTRGD
jgi:hypothetical protein